MNEWIKQSDDDDDDEGGGGGVEVSIMKQTRTHHEGKRIFYWVFVIKTNEQTSFGKLGSKNMKEKTRKPKPENQKKTRTNIQTCGY